MKIVAKFIICLLCFIAFNIDAKAVCNDSELNDFVEKLEIKFIAPRSEADFSKDYLDSIGDSPSAGYAYYFVFSEDNYKSDTKISDVLELVAIDGSGVAGEWKYQEPIAKYGVGGYNGISEETYTLKVKAISGVCKNQILKETTYTIPQFNMYVQTAYCEKYPDHELCQTFTNKTKDMNDADFGKAMAAYEREISKDKLTIKSLFLKYYIYVLCVIVPFILVSIYYKRRINKLIKLQSQEEERHIKRRNKVELFILAFVLLIPSLHAASNQCDVLVENTRLIAEISGTKVSVMHCSWTRPEITRYGEYWQDIVRWGQEEVWGNDRCTGEGRLMRRCVLHVGLYDPKTGKKPGGGGSKLEIEPWTKTVYCYAEGEPGECSVSHNCSCNPPKYDCPPKSDEEKDGDSKNTNGKCEEIKNCGCKDGRLCPEGRCIKISEKCRLEKTESYPGIKETNNADEALAQEKIACDALTEKLRNYCEAWGYKPVTPYDKIKCEGGGGYLTCPSHTCERTYDEITPTIDTYQIDGVNAYCVNPGEKAASNYKEVNIDANECAEGNSSVDCGYINILLEAEYFNKITQNGKGYQIPTEVITLATRLWGAYTNQGGYSTIGLGLYSGNNCQLDVTANFEEAPNDPFKVCQEMVYLDSDGKANNKALNVYRETVEYMLTPSHVSAVTLGSYDTLQSVEVKDAPRIFKNLECLPGTGIICGNTGNNMKYALALFFNTKNGNKKFKEHLNAVYGELSVRPANISISTQSMVQSSDDGYYIEEEDCVRDDNGNCKISKTILSVEFSEEVTTNSKRIECTDLKEKQKKNQSLTAEELTILNYCNIEVYEVRAYHQDKSYTLYTKDSYRECSADNVCGASHKFTGAIGNISACQKSTCVVATRVYADCKEDVTHIVTKVRYKKTKSTEGFKKYVSCTAPNPRVNDGLTTQFFYQMVPQNKISDDSLNNSNNGNGPDDEIEEEVSEEYLTYPYCEADCTDLNIKETGKDCSNPVASDIDDYSCATGDKTYETSIHDPSLSCILNTYPSAKTTYDYSDYFGVNTDICRVYCSDSVHTYMPDKTVTYSGLSLKYDIEYNLFSKNTSAQSLSSVIEMRRDCVSEIYFDYLDSNKPFNTIAAKYGFDTSMIDKYNVNDWISLYNAVYHRVSNYENNRNETLTKLIYDLYNCNMYTDIPIEKPKDNTTGSIFGELIPDKYSKNYGFEGCTLNSSTNTCLVYDGVTYDGGAKYASDSVGAKKGVLEVGDNRDTIRFNYTLELNKKVNGKDLPTISDVRYCKGKGCFDYQQYVVRNTGGNDKGEANIKNGDYLLPNKRKSKSISDRLYTVNAYNPSTGKYETTQKKFIEYEGTNSQEREISYINNGKKAVKIKVPTNDYAYFTISTKVGFYNTSKFQSQPYSGSVYDNTNGSPYYEAAVNSRTTLDQGLFPISSQLNECTVVEGSKKGTNYYRCNIRNHLGVINTYHRNYAVESSGGVSPKALDRFYTVINATEKTTFSCSYVARYVFDNKPQAVYRNVELTNPFPSDREIGKNWMTGEAQDYVENIKNYINKKGQAAYYDSHVEYSYTFTQKSFEKIKEDNAKRKSYIDNDIYGNTEKNVIENKYYTGLRSRFIDIIEVDGNEFGVINNRKQGIRGVSEYTAEKIKEEG